MINTIRMSLKIDSYYAANSLIYYLRKLPILNDLITDDIYKSKTLKNIIKVIAYILSLGRRICFMSSLSITSRIEFTIGSKNSPLYHLSVSSDGIARCHIDYSIITPFERIFQDGLVN